MLEPIPTRPGTTNEKGLEPFWRVTMDLNVTNLLILQILRLRLDGVFNKCL